MRISKSTWYQILFIICVIIPFLNIYELSFATWLFTILITLKNNYSLEFFKYLLIFIVILILATIVGFFFNYEWYYILRDITYMLKPISGLLLGYQLFNDKIKSPYKFLLNAGIAIAVFHLTLVLYGIFVKNAKSVADIRYYGGYFNDFEIYTFILLVFQKELGYQLTKKRKYIYFVILSFSFFFYLARTNFIQFIILFMALKGLFVLNKKTITIFIGLIIITITGYAAVYYYNPVRNGKGVDEFLYKIKMAPGEAFSTKINRDDWKDFNDNYRSYENIRTVQQLSYNKNLIFGEGIGSQVDLKQKVYLGDMKLRYISILHNGYMTVLLKTGLVGLIIYLLSISFFFKNNNYKKNSRLKYIHLFFVGTGVFLIMSNWVFMGFYNLLDTKSLFIGFLFAYKHSILKEHV
ncbi:O-antigen ligase family protein [Flavobacterium croceum]|uniref:O-antigen ligase family protein n=1 Tax=Flavobacterium croceum TaxID=370975 RepID=UPI0024A7EF8B|nr:O-antigen ligase family protein [Flavobacterium croceum]